MSEVFDASALMERVDEDVEFLEETVSMLDEDSPGLLEEIRAAVSGRDAAALVKAAHALKGMLANFCAASAESAARELETMGREERLNDVEQAFERAEQETQKLRAALLAFLQSRTG